MPRITENLVFHKSDDPIGASTRVQIELVTQAFYPSFEEEAVTPFVERNPRMRVKYESQRLRTWVTVVCTTVADTRNGNAVNYVSESVQGGSAAASKEVNKEIAKDSDLSLGTRLHAGIDALKDKSEESGHDAKAEVYKQKLTH
ncbi:hypothetical protein PROFUN_05395 [Planoprotostelium fungivorum]|uniref:Uncharacterized protein n=1 Tax=Planoprotostelium fungivorum TaxID=1890364 RepID=A0A2P6NQN9_9EUKA|nr:hypothetical protein PROFUN_05395 [Planoprotostelium fungivorum]